jgi:hypothetical protein
MTTATNQIGESLIVWRHMHRAVEGPDKKARRTEDAPFQWLKKFLSAVNIHPGQSNKNITCLESSAIRKVKDRLIKTKITNLKVV